MVLVVVLGRSEDGSSDSESPRNRFRDTISLRHCYTFEDEDDDEDDYEYPSLFRERVATGGKSIILRYHSGKLEDQTFFALP